MNAEQAEEQITDCGKLIALYARRKLMRPLNFLASTAELSTAPRFHASRINHEGSVLESRQWCLANCSPITMKLENRSCVYGSTRQQPALVDPQPPMFQIWSPKSENI